MEVAEAEEDGEGDDSAGRNRSEEWCSVWDAGDKGAVDGENGSQEVEAANEEARNPQERT
jgi:hypothetical protein